MKRNNNQLSRWKPYQIPCVSFSNLRYPHTNTHTHTKDILDILFASKRLMRSQENLLVNINLSSASQTPMICLNISLSFFFAFSIIARNKRLLSDYISWENHFDHVDIKFTRCCCSPLWYPLACVCVVVGMNDYAISWVRANRRTEREREQQTWHDKALQRRCCCCWCLDSFSSLWFLCNSFYYAFKSLNIATISSWLFE